MGQCSVIVSSEVSPEWVAEVQKRWNKKHNQICVWEDEQDGRGKPGSRELTGKVSILLERGPGMDGGREGAGGEAGRLGRYLVGRMAEKKVRGREETE